MLSDGRLGCHQQAFRGVAHGCRKKNLIFLNNCFKHGLFLSLLKYNDISFGLKADTDVFYKAKDMFYRACYGVVGQGNNSTPVLTHPSPPSKYQP